MRRERKTEATWVGLCDGPVDVSEAHAFVRDERAGAIALFVGTTRRYTEGKETRSLEYEAYDEMALDTLAGLASEAEAKWSTTRVAVIHATGSVPLREASVCVAVSTPHRKDAFEAARFLIDRLKTEAAIWKKEEYFDGSAAWVDPSCRDGPD